MGHPELTWATLYNRVGVVKRHVDREGFDFPFVGGFGVALGVAFAFAHATKARFQNPAVEALVPPIIYPVTYFRP
jgi:hypothetical protein